MTNGVVADPRDNGSAIASARDRSANEQMRVKERIRNFSFSRERFLSIRRREAIATAIDRKFA